jgi:hypothetical protein
MENEKNYINSKEAQEALDSIRKMNHAGLKRVLPTPFWLGATLALLIGTHIGLLGAGIRTYNTILIVLICLTIGLIANQNRLTGATERLILSNRTLIILLICAIPTYFLLIITAQYLKGYFGYNWAPFVAGVLATIGIGVLVVNAHYSYFSKFKEEKSR